MLLAQATKKPLATCLSEKIWMGGARDPVASDASEAFYRAVQRAFDQEVAALATAPSIPASAPPLASAPAR